LCAFKIVYGFFSEAKQLKSRMVLSGRRYDFVNERHFWEAETVLLIDDLLLYAWMPTTPSSPVTTLMAGALANCCR